jgi:DNA invertase Pin-like site-specific DNA recombinase
MAQMCHPEPHLRATARMLGVDHSTICHDLKDGDKSPKEDKTINTDDIIFDSGEDSPPGATQRATAKMLGVDVSTINRDINNVANATKIEETTNTKEMESDFVANATPGTPHFSHLHTG